MKKLLFILIFCYSSTLNAQYGSGANNDLFLLAPVPTNYGIVNQSVNSLSLCSSQTLNPAVRNLIIIAAGQSNLDNISPTPYVPVNADKICNYNIYDGAAYTASDPLLGCTLNSQGSGHPALRLADSLIVDNKFDKIWIASVSISNTLSSDWGSGFASKRILTTLERLASRGIINDNANVIVIVIIGQGEADNTAGVSLSDYIANWTAGINISNFSGKWFFAKQTYINGAISTTIQNAQIALINHNKNIWAGPDADALVGNICGGLDCRQSDLTHWSNAGSASYATAWKNALIASGTPFN